MDETLQIVDLSEINRLVFRMPEGDRARVLRFCRALTEQRQGKREQRRKRFQ